MTNIPVHGPRMDRFLTDCCLLVIEAKDHFFYYYYHQRRRKTKGIKLFKNCTMQFDDCKMQDLIIAFTLHRNLSAHD